MFNMGNALFHWEGWERLNLDRQSFPLPRHANKHRMCMHQTYTILEKRRCGKTVVKRNEITRSKNNSVVELLVTMRNYCT